MPSIDRDTRGKTLQSFRIADTITLQIGGYAALASATGDAVAVSDTAGHIPLGLVTGFDSPNAESDGQAVGATSADDPPEAVIAMDGGISRKVAVVGVTAQGNVGELVYATATNTFTLTATTNIPAVGRIVRFHSGTSVDVLFFDFETMNAS